MAKAQTSEIFKCSPEQFFKIVTDYEKYPEFLNEVKSCKVLKVEGNRKLVEYQISVMKTFKYNLWMTEEAPHKVSWEFAGGDLFKSSVGYWEMKEEAGQCRATYSIEANFTMFVPGPIANALVSVNLPNMISSYHKRISQIYGGK